MSDQPGTRKLFDVLFFPLRVTIALLGITIRSLVVSCTLTLMLIVPPIHATLWLLHQLKRLTGWTFLPTPPEGGIMNFYKYFFRAGNGQVEVMEPVVSDLPGRLDISEPYVYRSLHVEEREEFNFRILEILPASDSSSPLCMKIYNACFSTKPTYEALSYCCGESTETWPIYIDNTVFYARTNLVQALQRFRQKEESRFVWADAISIDQGDSQASLQERSKQVAMMGDIYKNSSCTLIWLGIGTPATAKGFEFVKVLNDLRERIAEIEASDSIPLTAEERALPGLDNPQVRAFLALQSNPWFTRVWIIQEVALAAKSTITLGHCTVDWADFYAARESAAGMELLTMAVDETCNGPFAIAMARAIISNSHNLSPQQQKLLPLFLRLRKFGATDARDKIFGLFGLFPPSKYTHPLLLAPNYEWSIVEVYSKVAKCILDQDQNLDILAVPRSHSKASSEFLEKALKLPGWAFSDPPRLPSWAPSWYSDENIVPLRPDLLWYDPGAFRASSDSTYELGRLSSDHALLGVDGYPIGEITAIGAVWPDNFKIKNLLEDSSLDAWTVAATHQKLQIQHSQAVQETICSWREVGTPTSTAIYPAPNETYASAFWQTILAGHIPPGKKDSLYASYLIWCLNMGRFAQRRWLWIIIPLFGSYFHHTSQIPFLSLLFWPVAQYAPLLSKAIKALSADPKGVDFLSGTVMSIDRRMARVDGGWTALVPGDAREGDQVFILKGGRVPIVLREKGENWEVVGEAYVHGIMEGELWDEERCREMWLE